MLASRVTCFLPATSGATILANSAGRRRPARYPIYTGPHICGFAIISTKMAITPAKAGQPRMNQMRNSR